MKCPQCGQETNDVVCSCGYRFPAVPTASAPKKRFCSNCGAEVTGKFCAKCGTPVQQPTTYSPPQNTAQYASQSSSKSTDGDPSKNGLAVAGFVLSLISFLFSMLILPIITAIIGLVLSVKGHKSEKKKMATAGIVLGVLAIIAVFGFVNAEDESDAPDSSTRSVSSSSVASKTSSKSASKVSNSRSASQPLEVKEPTTSYEEISFYVPEDWEYEEIKELPYYYYDDTHFFFIQTVEAPNDAKFSLSQLKNQAVTGFESNGSSKKTRDLDTSKYNLEMSAFEGKVTLDSGSFLTSTYILKGIDYVYIFNFVGSTEDNKFDSQKDLILNSIVVPSSTIQVSKPVETSKEPPRSSVEASQASNSSKYSDAVDVTHTYLFNHTKDFSEKNVRIAGKVSMKSSKSITFQEGLGDFDAVTAYFSDNTDLSGIEIGDYVCVSGFCLPRVFSLVSVENCYLECTGDGAENIYLLIKDKYSASTSLSSSTSVNQSHQPNTSSEPKASSETESTSSKDSAFKISNASIQYNREFGTTTVMAEITNNSSKSYSIIGLTCNFYDANGKLVDRSSTLINDLASGETKSFELFEMKIIESQSCTWQIDYKL